MRNVSHLPPAKIISALTKAAPALVSLLPLHNTVAAPPPPASSSCISARACRLPGTWWAVPAQPPGGDVGDEEFFIGRAHLPSRKALSVQSPAGTPASLSRRSRRSFRAAALAFSWSVAAGSAITAATARSFRRTFTTDPIKLPIDISLHPNTATGGTSIRLRRELLATHLRCGAAGRFSVHRRTTRSATV